MRNHFFLFRISRFRKQGFSLVETIIALLILSIALLAMAFVPIMSTKLALQATCRERAMFLAVKALDSLEAKPFNVAVKRTDFIDEFTLTSEKTVFNQNQPEDYIGKANVMWKGIAGQNTLFLERRLSKFSSETRKE